MTGSYETGYDEGRLVQMMRQVHHSLVIVRFSSFVEVRDRSMEAMTECQTRGCSGKKKSSAPTGLGTKVWSSIGLVTNRARCVTQRDTERPGWGVVRRCHCPAKPVDAIQLLEYWGGVMPYVLARQGMCCQRKGRDL